jgi:hypothetical protein
MADRVSVRYQYVASGLEEIREEQPHRGAFDIQKIKLATIFRNWLPQLGSLWNLKGNVEQAPAPAVEGVPIRTSRSS